MKEKNIDNIRHSLSHIMALAVKQIWPEVKFGIGPSIDTGFYYDFDFGEEKIGENDLEKIESKMRDIIKGGASFEVSKKDIDEAIKIESENSQLYKVDLLKELKNQGENIVSYYSILNFKDLCCGPHIDNLDKIDLGSFKLDKIAGAYWRGSEKNKMLTRIYGLAFNSRKELAKYENMIEEGKKRDHRKLGKELGLYTIRPEVGAGLILWKPKGAMILNVLKNWFEKEQLKKGYVPVITPHIGKKDLWVTSGHWNFYNDSMYPPLELGQTLEDYQDERRAKESEIYLLKPMNCPFHIMIYNDDLHSYRNLPLKYYEFGTVYRYEQTGELGGLTRVRGFTQDDAHIICTKEQLKEEMGKVVDFAFYILRDIFGFELEIRASFRDKNNQKEQMGSDTSWDLAEETILNVLKNKKIEYELDIGEAAFYGPKIDIKVKDAIGRLWQLSTVQFDFNLPEKFNMKFKNKKGDNERPFVIHRALLGSLERFMGVLIEHYAGSFPFWLSPIQIRVISVSETHQNYCQSLAKEFLLADYRIDSDTSNETVGNKVRKAIQEKIPYIVVIGDNEIKNTTLAVRERGEKDMRIIDKEEFFNEIKEKTQKMK